jgi:hypothetical protein
MWYVGAGWFYIRSARGGLHLVAEGHIFYEDGGSHPRRVTWRCARSYQKAERCQVALCLLQRIAQPSPDLQPFQARFAKVRSGSNGQVQDRDERAAAGGGGLAGSACAARAARRHAALGLARPPRARSS